MYKRNLQYYVFLMYFFLTVNNLKEKKKETLEYLLRSIVENSRTYYFVLDEMNRIISELQ